MIFSSIIFLCVFLPVTLILYYLIPQKGKNTVLLLASLIFYAWGEPVYVFLMIFSIVFNYLAGIQFEELEQAGNKEMKRSVFLFTVVVNIAILSFFKYYGFLLRNINSLFRIRIPVRELALPIGISFYTFQALSYVIDVYRGKVQVQKNIIRFGTYITMFPQLIAGPIVQYEDIENQLTSRTLTLPKIANGAAWFIRGLGKKVLLANNIGLLYDTVFSVPAAERAALTTLLGVLAFTFQIYFDFSGYSDMAIGLGKMFGFNLPQNFDYPYISKSITEFWRRWHISLGSWFREYVYIPLGGNRVEKPRHIRNILIVWGLTGLWHGADWCYLIWGLYFGVLLLLEKYVLHDILEKAPSFVSRLYTLVFVVIGWMIFSAPSLRDLGANFGSLFGALGNGFADAATGYYFSTHILLFLACILCSTPLPWGIFNLLVSARKKTGPVIAAVIYILIFLTSTAFLVNATYNPFLYFKF